MALTPERAYAVARGLILAVAMALVIALLAVTFSSRGLTGTSRTPGTTSRQREAQSVT